MTIVADVTTDRNPLLSGGLGDRILRWTQLRGTLREVSTDKGVLRYHEAGTGPDLLLLHGSGPG